MKYLAAILVFLALATATPDASAQPFPRQGGQEMQSLNSILGNIRRQFPGQLSDVQGPVNGRYLIKWLTPDGQILFIETDARTGQIIGVRGGGGGDFRRQNFAPMGDSGAAREQARNERLQRGQGTRPSVERRRNRMERLEGWGR